MANYKLTRQGVRDLSSIPIPKVARRIIEAPGTYRPTIYKIFVSTDCGIHYKCMGSGTKDELSPIMRRCDKDMLRWYTEEVDGGKISHISRIHSEVLNLMSKFP